MYILINGSPKYRNSNSLYFLNIISKHLEEFNLYNINKDSLNDIVESLKKSEVIVLAFPLHVGCSK